MGYQSKFVKYKQFLKTHLVGPFVKSIHFYKLINFNFSKSNVFWYEVFLWFIGMWPDLKYLSICLLQHNSFHSNQTIVNRFLYDVRVINIVKFGATTTQ